MSKAKAVTASIRLVINAGQAKPSPPVGPALGQAGLKIMDFCKDFNAKTADFKVGPAAGKRGPSGRPAQCSCACRCSGLPALTLLRLPPPAVRGCRTTCRCRW